MLTVVVMLGAYLLGGVPVGYLLARRAGIDVRAAGSGNIGATNVARTAGRALGFATLLLDAAKGALPAALGASLGGPRLAAGAACAAVLGHVFSPYLGFRGGKGVATAAGAFLVLGALPTLAAMVFFAVVFGITRVVSLGSVCAALALPIACGLAGTAASVTGLASAVALLVLARHAKNLARLARGEEPHWQGGSNPQTEASSPQSGGAGPQGSPAPPEQNRP